MKGYGMSDKTMRWSIYVTTENVPCAFLFHSSVLFVRYHADIRHISVQGVKQSTHTRAGHTTQQGLNNGISIAVG